MSDEFRFNFSEKTALVTGAGGDLGRQSALALGRSGARVFVTDHEAAAGPLKQTVMRLRDEGIACEAIPCDVTDESAVETTVAAAASSGGLDVLVNAAGVMLRKAMLETSLEEWRRVIEVNLTGTWLLNREAARQMSGTGKGKIINFASVYAERVGPLPESAYYTSKSAVGNLTRSVASEFGPSGIHVNCLALGVFYPTNMTAPLKDAPETLRWMSDRTLLKRLGRPELDLDGPLLLLASTASDYITGQIIYVDGGWSAW